MALEYLKELRSNGTDRRTEMSTLISGGFLEYKAIKDAEEAEVSANNVFESILTSPKKSCHNIIVSPDRSRR